MRRQIKGSLYFLLTNTRYSLLIFWTILMSITVITLTVSYLLKGIDNSFMTLSLTGPIYVYCAILGFLTVKESIPFSIKIGATRKNFFISLGIFFLGVSIAKSIVASIIQVFISFIKPKIGIDNFSFIHLSYLTNDTWIHRILIDTSITFLLFALMFVVGLLFYNYGLAGGGTVVAMFVIVVLVGAAQGWLLDFFIHIYQTLDYLFFWKLLFVGMIIYSISWLMMRKITVTE